MAQTLKHKTIMLLWNKPTALWFASKFTTFLGFMLGLWVIYNMENLMFPVIKDFEVKHIVKTETGYKAYGEYKKLRLCELSSVTLTSVPEEPKRPRQSLLHMTGSTVPGWNGPVGFTAWGPANLPVSADMLAAMQVKTIEISAIHRCHGLWSQQTVYGYIHVEDLPK